MRSIERHLLLWLAGTLSLGLLIVALIGQMVMLDEMGEVFDAHLKNVAEALASHRLAGFGPAIGNRPPAPEADAAADEYEVVTTTWTPEGVRISSSDRQVELPFITVQGIARRQIGPSEWIIYSVVRDDIVAQAAQRVDSRKQMATESAAAVLPPMLALVVAASALSIFALRRGLRSLDAAAREVAARSEHSLEAMPTESLPREILPMVRSVNGLMLRLAAALTAQRRFLADAAHELRTPVTALGLQLQLLERADDETTRAAARAALRAGVERTQRLIEQLLQVARSGPDGEPVQIGPVDLGALVRDAVAHLSIKAEHRGIDLGAAVDAGIVVAADPDQLTVLLNNLIENALRYTPPGGIVDVSATRLGEHPVLRVIDNGPGIPQAQREAMFDRFHRGEAASGGSFEVGSGLGLAIVRAIADRHRATVELKTPSSGAGLEVEVVFALGQHLPDQPPDRATGDARRGIA